ncbi:hypothetical protein [Pseudoalteromonas sp. NJ631]|uniref:hypothetical protein n=1 Tax=Pseudoalteromonas sp. NJ631 TaxID=493915 RepID=UPI000313190C|nr:hypothetical protein [Pseudoalteromonas sp. NJ631]
MGSKSNSTSRQSTNNTSVSFGVQGDNNGFMNVGDGNTYNIQQTDHGLVNAMSNIGADMADTFQTMTDYQTQFASDALSDAFNFGSDINRDSLDFAENNSARAFDFGADALEMGGNLALDAMQFTSDTANTAMLENGDLARAVVNSANDMHAANNDFASNLFGDAVNAVNDSNERVSEMAYFTANATSDLARDVAASNADLAGLAISSTQDALSDAYGDAADQSRLAHKQALQFVDDMSRSDGQQLALQTNKTMMYVVVGVVGVTVVAMMAGRK